MRRLPHLALLLALLAVVLLALGPLGWRVGWWPFRVAFQTLMPWAFYCGLAAAAVALLALVFSALVRGRRHAATGILAFVLGLAIAYIPWHYARLGHAVPPIHDITTDWQNPPQFRAVLPLRAAQHANSTTYEGTKVSDLQRRAYPDIAPLSLALDSRKAFVSAFDTARRMGWTIVTADPHEGRIEASERSLWFGFTDDIVIRIEPAGNGSRVDIRSESRVGRSDFGVNAARVRAFLTKLSEAARQ